jgi:hypothetical protein
MSNTKDIKLTNLKVLIWGEAKSGKTTFAATFPRPFFFDMDNGMLTLAGKDIEYETYDGDKGYKKFRMDLPKIAERSDIDTLVIDSLSSMQNFQMEEIQKLSGTFPGTPQIQEYGLQIVRLRKFLYELVAYKKHVVLIGHEQVWQDEVTKETFILPLIIGKDLPNRLGNWFDEFYHIEAVPTKEGIVHKIRTKKSRKYSCGSRLNCLDELEEPSFQTIMKKSKEAGKV